MAIVKRTNNSGAMGGAGVQEIDIKREIRKELKKQQDELLDEYDKKYCSCPRCGEKYHLGPKNTPYQGRVLEYKFREEGCPFCKNSLEWSVQNKWKVMEFTFNAEDSHYNVIHIIKVLRVPQGYRKGVYFKEEVGL